MSVSMFSISSPQPQVPQDQHSWTQVIAGLTVGYVTEEGLWAQGNQIFYNAQYEGLSLYLRGKNYYISQ